MEKSNNGRRNKRRNKRRKKEQTLLICLAETANGINKIFNTQNDVIANPLNQTSDKKIIEQIVSHYKGRTLVHSTAKPKILLKGFQGISEKGEVYSSIYDQVVF